MRYLFTKTTMCFYCKDEKDKVKNIRESKVPRSKRYKAIQNPGKWVS